MKKYICVLLSVFVSLIFCCCAVGENDTKNPKEKYACIFPAPEDADNSGSFVATVIDEDFEHMTVQPMEWEKEYSISKQIKIDYGTNHYDYLYGIGRRIVIYYDGVIDTKDGAVIYTDDISTEGFREFELVVDDNMNRGKQRILSSDTIDEFDSFPHKSDRNLYYFNVDVNITVDGTDTTLESAIGDGKITLDGIIQKANSDVADGTAKEISYKDGGSKEYIYSDYKMIVYHTIDGNRDVYFTIPDFGINDMTS